MSKKTTKQKAGYWALGVLVLGVLSAVAYVFVLSGLQSQNNASITVDYKREYTPEEWDALTEEQRQEIRNRRMCEHHPDNPHNKTVGGRIRFMGVDCSNYF